MLENIFIIVSVLFACYVMLFAFSVYLRDNSIADVFWGLGFVIITILSYFLSWDWYNTQVLITGLVTIWGIRLTTHIISKKLPYKGKEDARYARWRESWTYFYTRSFFQVYLLQWALMLIISTPILLFTLSDTIQENMFLIVLWGTIAIVGLIYEIIADRQLKEFIKIKKEWEILTTWLRKYSRYPQYFGESIFWLGISLLSLQVSVFGLVWWWVITFLLLYVSGVPLLEARYAWNKKYAHYSSKTPVFIPKFKK